MKKLLLLILLACLDSSRAHAQREVGNGGDGVVTSDGAIRLRDLVDPGNCTWRNGKSILSLQPEIKRGLEKLQKVNPYLGKALNEQILKIKWCFTATLKKVDTNDDAESLTYYVDPFAQNKIQAGIRTVNTVYIDGSLLNSDLSGGLMNASDRPYFYIHEAMHAFLPMKTPMRNRRIRDAVYAIKDFNDGKINSDDLDTMISGGEILVPGNGSYIQDLLRILMDKSLSVQNRIAMAKPILDFRNNDLVKKQWVEIANYFSDEELLRLTELTGLTRFDFVKRMRHGFNELIGSDFGRCTCRIIKSKLSLKQKYHFHVEDKFTGEMIEKIKRERIVGYDAVGEDLLIEVYKTQCDFIPAQ
jgi:hypothetical protein